MLDFLPPPSPPLPTRVCCSLSHPFTSRPDQVSMWNFDDSCDTSQQQNDGKLRNGKHTRITDMCVYGGGGARGIESAL